MGVWVTFRVAPGGGGQGDRSRATGGGRATSRAAAADGGPRSPVPVCGAIFLPCTSYEDVASLRSRCVCAETPPHPQLSACRGQGAELVTRSSVGYAV